MAGWTERLVDYFTKSFVEHPDAWVEPYVRTFCKWWLDLIRNAIIVGVLYFFAEKSGSLTLKVLSIFTFAVFFAYCLSYTRTFLVDPFHGIKNELLRFALFTIVGGLISLAISTGTAISVWLAIDEIARVQGK
jgi:hypothetical protein